MEEIEIVRGVFNKWVGVIYSFIVISIMGIIAYFEFNEAFYIILIILIISFLLSSFIYLIEWKQKELVVTNKRVYGKISKKNKFSFDYSSIKSIEKTNVLCEVKIICESQLTSIMLLRNYIDIYNAIEKRLEEINKREE